ncbi:MAG: DUF2877 domain-containing protein [Chloroflexi bacterium]|nr:DUF2877 domain-containing protein [Chloroflexota bacterium]
MEWLGQARHPRVHSLYRQSLNLIDQRGELFSLVLAELGPGPFALVVQPLRNSHWPVGGFVAQLRVDSPVRLRTDSIEVGPLEVGLSGLKNWEPRPDWRGLRTVLTPHHLERLDRQLQQHAPSGSLAPLAGGLAASHAETAIDRKDLEFSLTRALARPAHELLSELVLGDPEQVGRAAAKLAGLGGGVTPAGDDFLLGAIHALWASADLGRAVDLARAVVEAAGSRTNAVSLAWLRAAARGEAANEWHALFEAVLQDRPIEPQVRGLIRRGHTSGADALAGFIAALRVLAANAEPTRPK